jgi:hypothetical protein
MVSVSVFTNEIDSSGHLVERLAAAFQVDGQELEITEGDLRYVQLGMPVYSDRYGRLIDFETDGEEWARNLPSAYRNGAIGAQVEEVRTPSKAGRILALAGSAAAVLVGRTRQTR